MWKIEELENDLVIDHLTPIAMAAYIKWMLRSKKRDEDKLYPQKGNWSEKRIRIDIDLKVHDPTEEL